MKFNWNKILNAKTVVHCDTEEKANSLLAEVEGWNNNYWKYYKDQTCYDIRSNAYGRLEYYKDKNYTILTYEDVLLKGDQTMKRIDIRKSCSNDEYDLEVMTYHNGNPIFFGIRNKNYRDYDVTVRISEKHLSFTQANSVLAPFGYELTQSTDWTKVEVGAEVKVVIEHENGMATGFKANFHSYLSATKQILVMNGNKVEVYNEDEVELI